MIGSSVFDFCIHICPLACSIFFNDINCYLCQTGVPEQAEIIPFEPDTGNAGAGKV